jgi:ketosteroid isomerase-like protein
MPDSLTNLDKVRRYLRAIEDGDATYVLSLFSPDAYVEQLPNKIYPQGIHTSVSQIPEASKKAARFSPVKPTRSPMKP